jgi:DNA helicase MCM8
MRMSDDFSERLKVGPGEHLDTIPVQLLRKYVAYARKYVRPKLSEAAACVLQQFYLRLRAQRGSQDCTPVTTRQLESLIRLTEVCTTSYILLRFSYEFHAGTSQAGTSRGGYRR